MGIAHPRTERTNQGQVYPSLDNPSEFCFAKLTSLYTREARRCRG